MLSSTNGRTISGLVLLSINWFSSNDSAPYKTLTCGFLLAIRSIRLPRILHLYRHRFHHHLIFTKGIKKCLGFGYHRLLPILHLTDGQLDAISSRFNLLWEILGNLDEEYYRCPEIHGQNRIEFPLKWIIPLIYQPYIPSTRDRNGELSMSNVICSCMIRIS